MARALRFLAVVLMLGPAAPPPLAGGEGQAGAPAADSDPGSAAAAFALALLNADRAQHGLAPLRRDPRLDAIAHAHSLDMRGRGRIGHVSPASGSPEERLRAAGFPALESGENVASGDDLEQLERALLASPGHRANLLSARFDRVGIGLARADDSAGETWYLTQLFARVQAPVEPARWVEWIRGRVAEQRRRARRKPLAADLALDALAASVARQGGGDLDATLRAALVGPRGGVAWSGVLAVGEPEQIELPEALLGSHLRRLGVGVHCFEDLPPPNVVVVLVGGR